jgi:hypothetical protein
LWGGKVDRSKEEKDPRRKKTEVIENAESTKEFVENKRKPNIISL